MTHQPPLPGTATPQMASTADDHPAMVADCQNRAAKLSQWEREFVTSLQSQLARNRRLSPRQSERLDEIWERATA